MHSENQISIYDFVWAISEAIDLAVPVLNRHHKKVAYIASCIAQEMGLSNDDIQDIILASMLHDIGALPASERINALSFEGGDGDMNQHAFSGYELLKSFTPLSKAAELIKCHHMDFTQPNIDVPIGSNIIHLADMTSASFDERREVLEQIPAILAKVNCTRVSFHPDALAAFGRLAKKVSFWVEAFSRVSNANIFKNVWFSRGIVELDTLKSFAKVIAQIIDFRSPFTATHSSGVAAVAMELCASYGFSERECKMMEIAGFLHDLGKLSISNDILEKRDALNETEFNAIRKHTYYTYAILCKIKGFEHIAAWAAYHHERPDGMGYPFCVKGRDFSKLSRIMAVADVVTALTEDRPYRSGMCMDKAQSVLWDMARAGKLDENIVMELIKKSLPRINDIRLDAQKTALDEYGVFRKSMCR